MGSPNPDLADLTPVQPSPASPFSTLECGPFRPSTPRPTFEDFLSFWNILGDQCCVIFLGEASLAGLPGGTIPVMGLETEGRQVRQAEVHRRVMSPRSWGPVERGLSSDGDWKRPRLPPRQNGAAAAQVSGAEVVWPGDGVLRGGQSAPAGTENCPEGSRQEPRVQLMKTGQGGQGGGIAALRPQGPLWVRGTSRLVSSAVPREGGAGRRRKDSQSLCSADAARRLG